jgi:hypothetical protein
MKLDIPTMYLDCARVAIGVWSGLVCPIVLRLLYNNVFYHFETLEAMPVDDYFAARCSVRLTRVQ